MNFSARARMYQELIKLKKNAIGSCQKQKRKKHLKNTKEAKKAISKAQGEALDGRYQKLGTQAGEKEMFKLAGLIEKKGKDLNQLKCIKDNLNKC